MASIEPDELKEPRRSVLASVIIVAVFGPPFLAIGIFATCRIASMSWQAVAMRDWIATEARIEHLELEEDHDDDGSSYRVICRYEYTFEDVQYDGRRVGLNDGSPYEAPRHHARLKAALERGESIRCYLNPRNPQQAVLSRDFYWRSLVFWIPFAVGFSAVGLTVIGGAIYWSRATTRLRAAHRAHPDEPWLWRSDWAARELRSGIRGKLASNWIIAFLANGFVWPFAFLFVPDVFCGDAPIWVWLVVIFPGIGLVLLYKALCSTVRLWPLRDSVFYLRSLPARLGGALEGDLIVPAGAAPESIRFELQCIIQEKRSDTNVDKVVWRSAPLVRKGVPYDAAMAGAAARDALAYSVIIDVPDDLEPTPIDDGYPHWSLSARSVGLERAGELAFSVPVFRGGWQYQNGSENVEQSLGD